MKRNPRSDRSTAAIDARYLCSLISSSTDLVVTEPVSFEMLLGADAAEARAARAVASSVGVVVCSSVKATSQIRERDLAVGSPPLALHEPVNSPNRILAGKFRQPCLLLCVFP